MEPARHERGLNNPAGWQSKPRKLNDDEEPTYLCTPKARVVVQGFDSLWLTNRTVTEQYAVVEAKAAWRPDVKLLSLLGEANDSRAKRTKVQSKRAPKSNVDIPSPTKTLPSRSKVMQMGHRWIYDRVRKDFPLHSSDILKGPTGKNYSRHVFAVTPVEAAEHMIAIAKIVADGLISNPPGAQKYAKDYAVHKIGRKFAEADLDSAEIEYIEHGKPKKANKGNRPK